MGILFLHLQLTEYLHYTTTLLLQRKDVTMALSQLACFLVVSLISGGLALQCYECNGITASDGLCEGSGNVGNKVECGQYCGLMKMEILNYDRFHSSVVSTDTRWRRGCTTDGSELTEDSEMAGKTVSGLGCEKLGDRSEDRKKISHTVCMCNSTLCNERNSGLALSVPLGVKIILTLCLALSLNNNY